MRNSNQILHGDQTRCEEFLQGRPRMLTRDLLAVANVPVKILSPSNSATKICNKMIIKHLTIPHICRYITLQNIRLKTDPISKFSD